MANGLPPLGRFKPNWPKGCRAADYVRPWSETVQQVTEHLEREEKADPHKFTIRQARERYVGQHRARIGLLNGKGINQNTHTKFAQNLTLCLGFNKGYTRPRKPIDVDRCFDELTYDDYRDFVHFWCDPAVVKSGRTGINYLRAFKQMLDGLKIKLPEGGEELFALKVSNATRIVRYQPEMLKKLLNCEDERARLFQLMFLNLGYYAIDIARLRFDHVTDAEGHPYSGRGDMFITRRREKTSHQNDFTTTCYVWPETKVLMEKFRAPPHPADQNSCLSPVFGQHLYMDGRKVFTEAVRRMVEMLERACGEAAVNLNQLDLIVPHQANGRIIEAVRGRLDGAAPRVVNEVADLGNTSSSTIPLALAGMARENAPMQRVGLCAFGAGYTFGAAILDRP